MAPRTRLPIRKLINRFHLQGETQRAIVDMMDTNEGSIIRVIQHNEQTGSAKAKQQPGRMS